MNRFGIFMNLFFICFNAFTIINIADGKNPWLHYSCLLIHFGLVFFFINLLKQQREEIEIAELAEYNKDDGDE
jgi:hypothetical protein